MSEKQESPPLGEHARPKRPKNLGFIVGWMVVLGMYQIFLAWRFGTFFEGTSGDLRKYYGGPTMEPLYAAVGIAALVIAWGGWLLLDSAFGAYNLWWLLQPETRAAFAPHPSFEQ